ncbi:MAG: hypothetical protein AAFR63_08305 [Cyanobacteria bacterium J06631_6]
MNGQEANNLRANASSADSNDVFVMALGKQIDAVVDFNRGDNAIALSGSKSNADLTFSGNNIILAAKTLANLNGFDTTSLTNGHPQAPSFYGGVRVTANDFVIFSLFIY